MNNANHVYAFVKGRVESLQKRNDPAKTAALAKLRRAVGKDTGAVQDAFEYIYEGLPAEIRTEITSRYKQNKPSYSETAIQTALSLYALHSQGNTGMHDGNDRSLGWAVGLLRYKNEKNAAGIKRRFDALATSKTSNELIYHARGIVQLLKQGEVKLDYAKFAKDLYDMQFGSDSANRVRRQWGREYYGNFGSEDDSKDKKENLGDNDSG
jgi:CRISPR system Cascade subunit CasB